jgi:hypothetical protein
VGIWPGLRAAALNAFLTVLYRFVTVFYCKDDALAFPGTTCDQGAKLLSGGAYRSGQPMLDQLDELRIDQMALDLVVSE